MEITANILSSSNRIELFDCIADLAWSGLRNYEPSESDNEIKLTKWDSVPPLRELLPDLIAKNSWNHLVCKLVNSGISSKSMYSSLLARSLYHSNKEAVEMILTSWRWSELAVTYCPLFFWQNTELSYHMPDFGKGLSAPINKLMEIFIQLVKTQPLYTLRNIDISDCILEYSNVSHQIKILAAESDSFCQSGNDKVEIGEKYTVRLHKELQRDENYICAVDPLNLEFNIRENAKLNVLYTFVTMTVSQIKDEYLEQVRKVPKIGQISTIWYNDLFKNELLYYSEKLTQLLNRLPNIFYLKLSVFRRQALDAMIDTVSSFKNGLLFLYIFLRNKQLYPAHIMSLSSSIHISTLQTLTICVTDLSTCGEELVTLITKISGTIQVLHLEQCKINTAIAESLFKAVATCSNLVSLDIRNNKINAATYMDAVNLAGLPQFAMFCASVLSWNDTSNLNLSQAFQDYRARHWQSEMYPRRIHVMLEVYWEITDKDPSDGESGFEESDE